jgi:hypothetical protein
VEIAVVGPPTPQRDELHRTALAAAPPGAVIACGDGDGVSAVTDGRAAGAAAPAAAIPLLAGRGPVDGKAAAYVCRQFTCRTPVTETAELIAALQ